MSLHMIGVEFEPTDVGGRLERQVDAASHSRAMSSARVAHLRSVPRGDAPSVLLRALLLRASFSFASFFFAPLSSAPLSSLTHSRIPVRDPGALKL